MLDRAVGINIRQSLAVGVNIRQCLTSRPSAQGVLDIHMFSAQSPPRGVFLFFKTHFFQASNLTPKTPDAVIAPYSRGSVLPETALGFSK